MKEEITQDMLELALKIYALTLEVAGYKKVIKQFTGILKECAPSTREEVIRRLRLIWQTTPVIQ